jgi:hypothetical protein
MRLKVTTVLAFVAIITVVSLRTTWSRYNTPTTVTRRIVTVSGKPLTGFFDGLMANKLYAPSRVRTPPFRPCKATPKREIGWLQRIIGPTVVLADCATGACTGSYWKQSMYTCSGGDCSGTYKYTFYAPDQAGPYDGYCLPGTTGCSDYLCGCDNIHCDSGTGVCPT